MLMRAKALFAAAALSLSACGQAADEADETKSGTRSAGPVSSISLRPGLYHVAQTGDVEIDQEMCIEAAAVAAGSFVAPGEMEDGWEIETNRMSGGKIEVAAHHPSGSRLKIEGTFRDESFSTEGVIEMKLNGETHVVRTGQRGRFASPACPDGA